MNKSKKKCAPWVERAQDFTNRTYSLWLQKLYNIAISRFEWENLPETCSERFIEQVLCFNGYMAGFYDENLRAFLIMPVTTSGMLNIMGYPAEVTAYGYNSYIYNNLVPYYNITAISPEEKPNCALLYDSYARIPIYSGLVYYARKLTTIDRSLDVNVNVQKTPWIVHCSENERLTIYNTLRQIDDYEVAVIGNKSLTDLSQKLEVLDLKAPFIGDKLQILKRQVWQEALTFLGIEANTSEKAERQVTDEIAANLGETESLRQSPLASRKEFCDQFNKLFNTNVSVKFRSNLKLSTLEEYGPEDVEGSENDD